MYLYWHWAPGQSSMEVFHLHFTCIPPAFHLDFTCFSSAFYLFTCSSLNTSTCCMAIHGGPHFFSAEQQQPVYICICVFVYLSLHICVFVFAYFWCIAIHDGAQFSAEKSKSSLLWKSLTQVAATPPLKMQRKCGQNWDNIYRYKIQTKQKRN